MLLLLLQNIYGAIKPLPEFAQRPQAPPADQDMADQGPPGAGSAAAGPFLVAWDLQADQGMAQVLLLARAAHCLQKLHEMDTARVQVAGTDEWQVRTCVLHCVLLGCFVSESVRESCAGELSALVSHCASIAVLATVAGAATVHCSTMFFSLHVCLLCWCAGPATDPQLGGHTAAQPAPAGRRTAGRQH